MNHEVHRRQPRFHCRRRHRRFGRGHHPIQIEGPEFPNPRAVWYIGWEPATADATE
jgi:hypothetical protein